MVAAATNCTDRPSPTRLVRWTIGLLSVLAAGIAAYLLHLSLASRGLPAGCGQGSGCEEVLTSRWSQIFGLPVSGAALPVYAAIMVTIFFTGPRVSPARGRRAWSLLIMLAGIVAGSAVWFVGLQFAAIGAVCPWCLAEHGLGLLIAALIVFVSPIARTLAMRASGLGVSLVALFALAQTFGGNQPPAVQRLPAGENADTGPGRDRQISVLNGKFELLPHEVPALGSPDAPKLVVVLFDYCCPHCRAAHGYLVNGLTTREGQFAVLLMPTPLNEKCNPFWEHTESRFEHACELARLALAVWRADPKSFAPYDRWLFEPELPRGPQEARRRAEELVGVAALNQAIADPWIDRQIEQNVGAYHNSQAERVPVILSPGMQSIVGRPESEEQLFQLLDKELGLHPFSTVRSST